MNPITAWMKGLDHSPGPTMLGLWRSVGKLPAGASVFSKLLSVLVPYTGSISPDVLEMSPGRARVRLRDRRGVRNHLRSVHAVALMNLGELATGLGLLTSQPEHVRGILTGLSMDFLKKARGGITATAELDPASVVLKADEKEREIEVIARLVDSKDECVAVARARWRISHAPSPS